MRILLTTDTVGGVWTFTRELTLGLLDKGCDIVLVSLGREPDVEQQRWTEATQMLHGSHFQFVSSRTPLEWMQQNNRALSGVSDLLVSIATQFDADVFHTNQFCFGALPVSIPRIVTAHSDVLSWAQACRREPLPESDWLHRYRTFVQAGLDGASIITAPTRSVVEGISRNYLLHGKVPQVMANGRTLLRPRTTARRHQAVVAGRVWDEAKGIAMLQHCSPAMPIMVAGESSLHNKKKPRACGALHFVGQLTDTDLLTLFAQSEVYICPSKYEPFGLAPLEAALCGCAVVANDLASLREIWDDAALYFHDATSLSHLLAALSNDRNLLEDTQNRCYTRAQRYSRERMASSYFEMYQGLTKDREQLADVA